jgi:DNA-binding transcriptional regulator YiaG
MSPDQFRLARQSIRQTQQQLADRLGVSRRTVINWETGVYVIKPITELAMLQLISQAALSDPEQEQI